MYITSYEVALSGLFHPLSVDSLVFFFFQAEDGIRDLTVTGVQTCALPISTASRPHVRPCFRCASWAISTPPTAPISCTGFANPVSLTERTTCTWYRSAVQIGRASCRERV